MTIYYGISLKISNVHLKEAGIIRYVYEVVNNTSPLIGSNPKLYFKGENIMKKLTSEDLRELKKVFEECEEIQLRVIEAYKEADIAKANDDWKVVGEKIFEIDELNQRFTNLLHEHFDQSYIDIVLEILKD